VCTAKDTNTLREKEKHKRDEICCDDGKENVDKRGILSKKTQGGGKD